MAADRRAALALAILVLAGVLLGGYSWWRSRPAQDTAPPRIESAGQGWDSDSATSGGAERSRATRHGGGQAVPRSGAATAVTVDVEGRVLKPGVVTLPPGARVADALRSAGGPAPGVDTSTLNLARLLSDGEQLLVGVANAAPVTGAGGVTQAGVASSVVDLNSAGVTELRTLPGVGPVLAQHVLEWRSAHGRFTSVDQLREVGGIGPRKFARLRDRVRI